MGMQGEPEQDYDYEDDYEGYEYGGAEASLLQVPGEMPDVSLKGVSCLRGDVVDVRTGSYCRQGQGKLTIILFYQGNWEEGARDTIQAFADLADQLKGVKAEVVACSADSTQSHNAWIKAQSEDGGFGGKLAGRISGLWSDPSGSLASQFDLYSYCEGHCLEGVVVVDGEGVVRHLVTTSLAPRDTATYCLQIVRELKGCKVDLKDVAKASSGTKSVKGSGMRAISPVKLSKEELEKDWDVSQDPTLLAVLQKAKMLARQVPPPVQVVSKPATFDLVPEVIRRMKNPRASVKWSSVSLQRNLAGFGPGGGLPKNQKVQLENLIKKVMGVAYMPEDLTGNYTSLSKLNQREQVKLLSGEVFRLSGDCWMKEPGSVQWEEGQGVFVNNYSNFMLWVNLEDQLRLVSFAKGQDLKYVLLRLQKAVARIEEALKMVFSTKSSRQRGFSTRDSSFLHDRQGVFGTGLECVFTMDLPGLHKAGLKEMEQVKVDLGLKIQPSRLGGSVYEVMVQQFPELTERDIVERSVEAVDLLGARDMQLRSN